MFGIRAAYHARFCNKSPQNKNKMKYFSKVTLNKSNYVDSNATFPGTITFRNFYVSLKQIESKPKQRTVKQTLASRV